MSLKLAAFGSDPIYPGPHISQVGVLGLCDDEQG